MCMCDYTSIAGIEEDGPSLSLDCNRTGFVVDLSDWTKNGWRQLSTLFIECSDGIDTTCVSIMLLALLVDTGAPMDNIWMLLTPYGRDPNLPSPLQVQKSLFLNQFYCIVRDLQMSLEDTPCNYRMHSLHDYKDLVGIRTTIRPLSTLFAVCSPPAKYSPTH